MILPPWGQTSGGVTHFPSFRPIPGLDRAILGLSETSALDKKTLARDDLGGHLHSLLKKGTGTSRQSLFAEKDHWWLGASPLFQHAPTWSCGTIARNWPTQKLTPEAEHGIGEATTI